MIRQLFVCMCALLWAIGSDAQVCNPSAFRFDVNNMNPQKYASRSVDGFFLEIRNDSAVVYLPYMGESHVAIINDDGLNFQEPIRKLKVQANRKGTAVEISFDVSHGMTKYRFYITASNGGYGDIVVIPSGADSCSYFGNWENTGQKE